MRNCVIHSGGRASRALVGHLATWTNDADSGWRKLAARSPRGLQVGDIITFSHGVLLIALAATKVLAREANEFIQPALPREVWADVLIDDLVEQAPSALSAPDKIGRAHV